VVQRRTADKYVVQFDEDGSERTVSLNEMRLCADLQDGDSVVLKSDKVTVSNCSPDGSFIVQQEANIGTVVLSGWDVDNEWSDRTPRHRDIICAVQS
jgi:hypothetical protein